MTPETNPDTTAPDTTAPDTQPDTADTLTIVVDHGITDRLDPLLGDRLGELRARIDARAGIHVDDRGIELRRLVRSRRLRWSSIDRIVLDNRLDLGLSFATRLLPVGRIPVLGDKLRTVVAELVEAATRRLMPEVRADAGWVVATFERSGALRDDVEVDATGAITALLHPDVTAAIELQAEQRGIPVTRS